MDIEQFTHELKRRGVVRAAGWYAIVSWIVMLVASVTVPILLGPSTVLRPMYALTLIGLPIWCGAAWLLGAMFLLRQAEVLAEIGDHKDPRFLQLIGAAPSTGSAP